MSETREPPRCTNSDFRGSICDRPYGHGGEHHLVRAEEPPFVIAPELEAALALLRECSDEIRRLVWMGGDLPAAFDYTKAGNLDGRIRVFLAKHDPTDEETVALACGCSTTKTADGGVDQVVCAEHAAAQIAAAERLARDRPRGGEAVADFVHNVLGVPDPRSRRR